MISSRETVMLSGTLRGATHEASCIVRAIKVSLPNLDIWEYVSAAIERAPSELPDGPYNVSFEGRTMKVKKVAGNWVMGAF
ncbi:hypothetical protein P8935_15830 [Telmatobacter sp. DSM 110680]|uniref:Uncharacterized protein n=1 Tax=Telmatobacter sp. DSM 110680 TaxID=3036704 RepID=A0AAU7DEC9_9BACT